MATEHEPHRLLRWPPAAHYNVAQVE